MLFRGRTGDAAGSFQVADRGHAAVSWLVERATDILRWPRWLVTAAPARSRRLAGSLRDGGEGAARFLIAAGQARRAGGMAAVLRVARAEVGPAALGLAVLATRLFDLLGGPEAAEVAWRGLTRTTPLTAHERAAASTVLGTHALRWGEVRVAEAGLLSLFFRLNSQRAFALWHTVNLPRRGRHTREHLPVVIHELVHVYQYERVGSAYIPQAIGAQHTAMGYGYGQAAGLQSDRAAGLRYHHYNREQQAQIVQDYFTLLHTVTEDERAEEQRQQALACYESCLAEARAGWI